MRCRRCSAAELPSPTAPRSLGDARAAESVLNVHRLGDSCSQMGPDRIPKNLICSSEASLLPRSVMHAHKHNTGVPGSSRMCVSWSPNLRRSMAWQRVAAAW